MSKNEPLKTNENGIVGKPAEPTVAPGGSDAAAAWVAGADAVPLVLGVDDEDDDELLPLEDELPLDDEPLLDDEPALDDDELPDEDEDEEPPDEDAPPVAPVAPPAGAVAVGPWPPLADSLSDRKSMRASCAALCSWYRSEATPSFLGTALPSIATAA
jgi:hypothetical protein